MERTVGARLQNMFQQLEKIGGKAAKHQTGDDLQQIRYVTCKIYQIVTTAEKIHRDSVLKNPAQLELLLQTLKGFRNAVYMDLLYWSSLPGLPRKMKWPVRVVNWEAEKTLVFCKADKAHFSVRREQLVPFPENLEAYKNKAYVGLKKKPETLKSFLADIEWALGATPDNVNIYKNGVKLPKDGKYNLSFDGDACAASTNDAADYTIGIGTSDTDQGKVSARIDIAQTAERPEEPQKPVEETVQPEMAEEVSKKPEASKEPEEKEKSKKVYAEKQEKGVEDATAPEKVDKVSKVPEIAEPKKVDEPKEESKPEVKEKPKKVEKPKKELAKVDEPAEDQVDSKEAKKVEEKPKEKSKKTKEPEEPKTVGEPAIAAEKKEVLLSIESLLESSAVQSQEGEDVKLEWKITGLSEADVSMYKDGEKVKCDDHTVLSIDGDVCTLAITSATTEDGATYSVGTDSSEMEEAKVTVSVVPKATVKANSQKPEKVIEAVAEARVSNADKVAEKVEPEFLVMTDGAKVETETVEGQDVELKWKLTAEETILVEGTIQGRADEESSVRDTEEIDPKCTDRIVSLTDRTKRKYLDSDSSCGSSSDESTSCGQRSHEKRQNHGSKEKNRKNKDADQDRSRKRKRDKCTKAYRRDRNTDEKIDPRCTNRNLSHADRTKRKGLDSDSSSRSSSDESMTADRTKRKGLDSDSSSRSSSDESMTADRTKRKGLDSNSSSRSSSDESMTADRTKRKGLDSDSSSRSSSDESMTADRTKRKGLDSDSSSQSSSDESMTNGQRSHEKRQNHGSKEKNRKNKDADQDRSRKRKRDQCTKAYRRDRDTDEKIDLRCTNRNLSHADRTKRKGLDSDSSSRSSSDESTSCGQSREKKRQNHGSKEKNRKNKDADQDRSRKRKRDQCTKAYRRDRDTDEKIDLRCTNRNLSHADRTKRKGLDSDSSSRSSSDESTSCGQSREKKRQNHGSKEKNRKNKDADQDRSRKRKRDQCTKAYRRDRDTDENIDLRCTDRNVSHADRTKRKGLDSDSSSRSSSDESRTNGQRSHEKRQNHGSKERKRKNKDADQEKLTKRKRDKCTKAYRREGDTDEKIDPKGTNRNPRHSDGKAESKFKRDKQNKKIFVRNFLQSKWNQVHACKFCIGKGRKYTIKSNISKHLRKHENEPEVKEILHAASKNGLRSKIVRAKWDLLRNSGDHKNNVNALEMGEGEVIIGRRNAGPLELSQYGPCPDCFVWLKIEGSTMYIHQNKCPAKIVTETTGEKKGKKVIRILSMQLAGKISPEASKPLKEEVFTIMTRDEISDVAQKDPLIVSLGNMWLLKNVGNRLKRRYYTSSHMRGAAKLLLNLHQLGEEGGFNELLCPKNFDNIVKATLMTASADFDDEEDLLSPSTAIKMGYDLKRLAASKWGLALRNEDEESARECKDFLKLVKFEWNVKVAKLASVILLSRRYNKEQSLPEPDDLFRLQKFIKEEINKLDLSDCSYQNFRNAEILAQTRLLIYNKRRSGEVEVVSIKDYTRRQSGISNLDRAMRGELSELEQKLLETQELMEVRGKFGRGVPIIVPQDVQPVLGYLSKSAVRDESGVKKDNKYMFPNTAAGVIRAYDSLKTLCKRVDLLKPQKITSVSLRKYTATMSQNATDRAVLVNIINICSELLGKTQVGKKASALVNVNATNIVFQTLVQEAEDSSPSEEFMVTCHHVLGRIGLKDRKFALKARLNRALLVTLSLIKNNITNFKALLVLLPVFKLYTNNSVNSSYLGKHNTIPPMCKVILQCSRKHATVLKYGLDILNNLTKSRNNAARTIGGEYVPHILALYNDWHQADTKHRHVNIRKGLLNILKNITNLRSGRKALVEASGIRILYESAQDVIDCREMEGLILLASVIMRKCCPRNKLPLTNIQSVVKFEKPLSELYPEDRTVEPGISRSMTDAGDSDNSSLDDDDDIDSDDERFKTDNMEENDDEQGDATPEIYKRMPEDLKMYNPFFPELFEIDVQENDQESIVIPTASYEPGMDGGRDRGRFRGQGQGVYNTMPSDNLHKSVSCPSSLYRIQRSPSDFTDTSGYSSAYTPHRGNFNDSDYVDSYSGLRPDTASAINLKTGASVISLDFPTSPSKNSGSRKLSNQKSKKAKGSKKSSKDTRKPKKGSKDTGQANAESISPFTDALCITPIPSARDYEDDLEPGLAGYDDDDEMFDFTHDPLLYQDTARQTKSVYKFDKVAYPDLCGGASPEDLEPLYHRKFGVQRTKVFEDIDRMIHPEHVIDREVYNLDMIKARMGANFVPNNYGISNRDELRIGPGGRYEAGPDCLRFNAQFESGNLRKAIWVRENEYDLILNPDINVNHHHQWFYFEVTNMIADRPYRFNIVNCEKLNSQFNFGMQPLLFSVYEAMEGRPYWVRAGSDICYYRNHFTRSTQATGGVKGKTYYTTTFTVTFKHSRDVCYMAYHYPYTYSTLQTHLSLWEQVVDHSQVFFRRQVFCETISGNPVPVVTITAKPKSYTRDCIEEFRSRPYIFLSARVHPGESNSSWVMKGTLDYLVSRRPIAQKLREMFIFKIVPMLNPDGVLNGNHRCSLAGEDLNRRWDNPCPKLHPTIYHTKGLMQYLQMINKTPLVFCDFHGHSRRKNIFIYGCSAAMSYIVNDTKNPQCSGNRLEDNGYKTLPRVLDCIAPAFSLTNCSFVVEKTKETTARMVVWRQIGVNRSYTMESTYCGMDREGKYKDQHISTKMLEEMGHKFCEGLLRLGRGRSPYETNSSMPSEEGLEQLGACGQDPDMEDLQGQELHRIEEREEERGYCGSDGMVDDESSTDLDYADDEDDDDTDL